MERATLISIKLFTSFYLKFLNQNHNFDTVRVYRKRHPIGENISVTGIDRRAYKTTKDVLAFGYRGHAYRFGY